MLKEILYVGTTREEKDLQKTNKQKNNKNKTQDN